MYEGKPPMSISSVDFTNLKDTLNKLVDDSKKSLGLSTKDNSISLNSASDTKGTAKSLPVEDVLHALKKMEGKENNVNYIVS
jgi:hypothetical protein